MAEPADARIKPSLEPHCDFSDIVKLLKLVLQKKKLLPLANSLISTQNEPFF